MHDPKGVYNLKSTTRFLLLSVLAATLGTSSWAASLIGSTVTGSFTVNGSSTNLFAPNTTVVVSPSAEFGYVDGAGNRFIANFEASNLEITEQFLVPEVYTSQQFVFMDSAFAGLALTPGSNNFPNPAFISSLVGTTLTITVPAEAVAAQTYQAEFGLAPAAAPEPSSYVLFGSLLLGMTPVMRRKLKSRA